MTIAIGSDHGGFELKEIVREYLLKKGLEIQDVGVFAEESVDYPDYALKVSEIVAKGEADLGILICGTGIGISIAANRVKGARCALVTSVLMAQMARKHNDANMVALGGRILDKETALAIVDAFLTTEFEGGRHQRRIDMLNE